MNKIVASQLIELGLTPTEAQVYLALIRNGPSGASTIAAATGLARTAVYPALGSLGDKGLIDAGEGYGSRFAAVSPEQALPSLISPDREALAHREQLTREVVQKIAAFVSEAGEAAPEELVQVIRNQRAVGDRFDRSRLEAEKSIEIFCKAPIFARTGDPVQEKVLRRGVAIRGVYEEAVLRDPAIRPYLLTWLAQGEDTRVYRGELPQKLAIFDRRSVLIPPPRMPNAEMKSLFIHHPQLASSLGLLFDSFWERSIPLTEYLKTLSIPSKVGKSSRQQRNGQTASLRGRRVGGKL